MLNIFYGFMTDIFCFFITVEADRQLNSTLEKRGYSSSQELTKEKPSTILKKIEIGTNYMKQYLAETMDG